VKELLEALKVLPGDLQEHKQADYSSSSVLIYLYNFFFFFYNFKWSNVKLYILEFNIQSFVLFQDQW